jgi:two-component system LytT family sensor kinase
MVIVQGCNKRREKMNLDQYLVSRNFQQADNRDNLELFKNLLQPHFLFNSLNNLYALSLRKSDETPEAIAGLSHLLERVVSFSRREMVTLSEEIGLIKDYITLEKIWLGECSFVMDFQVKGDTEGVSVPPLTIYTLIENAFKHGIRKCPNNGWITIHLVVKDDKILLKVRNGVQSRVGSHEITSVANTGLGIEAVRKMLDSSYRKQYHLDARSIGNVYAVDLIIGRVAA